MRIKGMFEVEGINLHIDIVAPDDEKNLYITNITPECLLIPPERWPIKYLCLSQETERELSEKNINNLRDLLRDGWYNKVTENTKQETKSAIITLREKALIFERTPPRPQDLVGFTIPEEPLVSSDNELKEKKEAPSPETPLIKLGVDIKMTNILAQYYGVNNLKDLDNLSEGRLVMTRDVTAEDIKKLKLNLREGGHIWPKKDKELKHLKSQGLKPAF